MILSEFIEILQKLPQDREVKTAMWEDGAHVFNDTDVAKGENSFFKDDIKEMGWEPEKVIVIS